MRRSARWSAILVPLLFVVSPASGPARAVEGDLTIDVHWFDAIQAADHVTMNVTETYFFNNTGSSEFSGNLSFRIALGARVASRACGGASNTIARLRGAFQTDCFFLQDLGGGIRQGTPFNGTRMSYYGQRETLTLRANSSLGDGATVALNVTVGAVPDGQAVPPPTAPGLHLAANDTELGGLSPSVGGLPGTLTYSGNFTVTNNRTENATVNVTATVGSVAWTATIMDGTAPLAAPLLLLANASKPLSLRVVVPNYLVQVELNYVVRMASAGDRRWSLPLDYLYPAKTAQYFIFLLESDNATGSAPQAGSFVLVHAGPRWQAEMDRWWFFFIATDLPTGARVDLRVYTEDRGGISPLVAGLLAIVGVAATSGLALYRRGRRAREPTQEAGEAEEEAEKIPETAAKLGKTAPAGGPGTLASAPGVVRDREALRRLEQDHEMGRIPDDSYERLKAKYEENIRDLEAAGAASLEVAELGRKKDRIVQAIKNLRAEREAGSVDPEVARELEARYQAEAITLMKRLEALRK